MRALTPRNTTMFCGMTSVYVSSYILKVQKILYYLRDGISTSSIATRMAVKRIGTVLDDSNGPFSSNGKYLPLSLAVPGLSNVNSVPPSTMKYLG